MVSREITVINKTGIHSRPASMFVTIASKFKSNITVIKDTKKGNAKSIFNVIALGITKDSNITITAEGEDAAEAVDSLIKLVESKFGEA